MLIHEKGGDMVNVPLKKKNVQVSSPGRATPAPNYKNDERGGVLTFKTSFPPFRIFDSVLRFCSSPTSKCSIPKLSSFSLVYFDLLLVL